MILKEKVSVLRIFMIKKIIGSYFIEWSNLIPWGSNLIYQGSNLIQWGSNVKSNKGQIYYPGGQILVRIEEI
jgi:hypothetical protein